MQSDALNLGNTVATFFLSLSRCVYYIIADVSINFSSFVIHSHIHAIPPFFSPPSYSSHLSIPYLSISHIPTHTRSARSPPVSHTPSARARAHTHTHTHTHTRASLNGFLRRGAVQSINISQL